ncbi:hypothetical protein ACSFA2_22450 [Variovorax sp. LT2P21]|uniref:hypothetical protein n=1 Tax=Variovorax sp. LT2P21 TaxID=3443731 RepID=UPI003F460140
MDRTFDAMMAALEAGDLVAALKVLNEQVAQRYSAVYRLTPDRRLENVAFVDKLDLPYPEHLRAVPYGMSFCQFTFAHGEFQTSDSSMDRRLDGHPYKGLVNSYHAVPLVGDDGEVTGTICHFDLDAAPLADENFVLLKRAARVIQVHLPHPRSANGPGSASET